MFGILLSALNSVFGFAMSFFFRTVVVKFFLFFGLFFVTTELVAVLMSSGIIPDASKAQGYLNTIGAPIQYFLNMFAIYDGMALILSAYATRFMIRRIPFIG